jgi:hypothetical protein
VIRKPYTPTTAEGLTPARASVPVFKPKTCAKAKGGCGLKFTPTRPMQPVCQEAECRVRFVTRQLNKKTAERAKADKALTRAQREAIKTKPKLCDEVERAMNAYVRQRDFADGCISCGKQFEAGKLGGSCDAGHYRSKGSAIHLRFDPRNVHAQCKHCNDAKGKAGNPVGYRRGLILKIGLEAVEALECDQEPRKHTRDELRALRAHYRALVRQMKGSE